MNQKTNTIKWLAIVTMTIDHIGYYLFPQLIWLRVIGRIAFPCFLYTTIYGVEKTRDFWKYIQRLLLTGVVSMPITAWSGNYLNILFTLALFAISQKDRRYFFPCLLASFFTEYSIYGFLLGWALWMLLRFHKGWGLLAVAALHIPIIQSVQFYAVLALIPMLLIPDDPEGRLPDWQLPRFPKLLAYGYYPLHQLVLLAIRFLS